MKVDINEKTLRQVYKYGDANTKITIEQIIGKKYCCKTIMEIIKTFQDAKEELGPENVFVKEYNNICSTGRPSKDLLAYLRLRIITAALNEGWEPDFTNRKQDKYYPWFWLYTRKELDELSDMERKKGISFGANANSGAYCGFLYANTSNAPSVANAGIGSRLCFKSKELAEYAGRQFIGLYLDFLIGGYGKQD
jgi:hypothetical protein